jgi:Bacterial dnaA protein helix-turn-helix
MARDESWPALVLQRTAPRQFQLLRGPSSQIHEVVMTSTALVPVSVHQLQYTAYKAVRERLGLGVKSPVVVRPARPVALSLPHCYVSLRTAIETCRDVGRAWTRREILMAVSMATDVSGMDLVSPRRDVRTVFARHVYFHLAKVLTDHSLPGIGIPCGGKNHSTVLHGIRKITDNPSRYQPTIDRVMAILEGRG